MLDLYKIARLYGQIYETKEEMFLIGYLMACGGELSLLKDVSSCVDLIEKDPDFLSVVKDILRTRKKVFDENVKEAKRLLRRLLKERGAPIPEWLEYDIIQF